MNPITKIVSEHVLVDKNSIIVDLSESKDSWLFDLRTKKKYLDLFGQFSSQVLGWNNKKLLAYKSILGELAINKLANSDVMSEVYADFVKTVASIASDFKYHFYIESSGALAVESALKVAFDWKAKKDKVPENELDVIHFTESFHGRSGYTLSLTNNPYDATKTALFPKFNWTRIESPYIKDYPVNNEVLDQQEGKALAQISTVLKKGKAACVIIEAITGEGGNREFRPSFFKTLRELCDKYNTLLVFDEVQTFLNTGKWWAYQHYDVVPDIVCFAKKMQVGGICCTTRVDSVKDNVFHVHSRINSTFGGSYIDMARASIILDIVKRDKLVDYSAKVGSYFMNKLKELELKNVRGKGLMIAFDLENSEIRDKFYDKLSQKVLALKCGLNSIRFRPHLTLTTDEVDYAIDVIKEINLGK